MTSFFEGNRVRLIPELDDREDRPICTIIGKNTPTVFVVRVDGDPYLKLIEHEMLELAPS